MAKLYAELSSDKGGRKVSKGGNANVHIEITHNARQLWTVTAGAHGTLTITRGDTSKVFNSLNW